MHEEVAISDLEGEYKEVKGVTSAKLHKMQWANQAQSTGYCVRQIGFARDRTNRRTKKISEAAAMQMPVISNSSFVAWKRTHTIKIIAMIGMML